MSQAASRSQCGFVQKEPTYGTIPNSSGVASVSNTDTFRLKTLNLLGTYTLARRLRGWGWTVSRISTGHRPRRSQGFRRCRRGRRHNRRHRSRCAQRLSSHGAAATCPAGSREVSMAQPFSDKQIQDSLDRIASLEKRVATQDRPVEYRCTQEEIIAQQFMVTTNRAKAGTRRRQTRLVSSKGL